MGALSGGVSPSFDLKGRGFDAGAGFKFDAASVRVRVEGRAVHFDAAIGFDGDTALCGIEQAYNEGIVDWKKPVSCHLYPIRIKDFSEFAAVNYDRWDICDPACTLGKELQVPVYQFVKEALIRRFGENWYTELEKFAKELAEERKR
jgi:hypothetical protein